MQDSRFFGACGGAGLRRRCERLWGTAVVAGVLGLLDWLQDAARRNRWSFYVLHARDDYPTRLPGGSVALQRLCSFVASRVRKCSSVACSHRLDCNCQHPVYR